MEAFIDDELYEKSIKLYPENYVMQQSYYESKRDKPKFAKMNDCNKEK